MTRAIPPFAISVRQPWAWAIIHAGKDVENRVKRAITLGRMDRHPELAIHAATGMTRDEYESARDFMASIGVDCPRPDKLVRGAIIGSVTIQGITKNSPSKWFFGPWALMLIRPLPTDPVPCVGHLGAFEWERGYTDEVREPLPWMKSWPDHPGRASRPPREDNSEQEALPL